MSTTIPRATIIGSEVKDKITAIRSSSTITDIHIAMAVTGFLSGTFAIFAILSSIKKMFCNGRVNGQEDENTEAVIDIGRGYVETNLFELENAENGFVFRSIPPLDHHDFEHYEHKD
ncbi:uncharacterized protein LOC134687755 [Mytilus trossulus]|uniref:uncharacterized protein LOC134687755 n=1 Tax=Mytilus trossulus TaxID=6551 RepID=UPI0030071DD0